MKDSFETRLTDLNEIVESISSGFPHMLNELLRKSEEHGVDSSDTDSDWLFVQARIQLVIATVYYHEGHIGKTSAHLSEARECIDRAVSQDSTDSKNLRKRFFQLYIKFNQHNLYANYFYRESPDNFPSEKELKDGIELFLNCTASNFVDETEQSQDFPDKIGSRRYTMAIAFQADLATLRKAEGKYEEAIKHFNEIPLLLGHAKSAGLEIAKIAECLLRASSSYAFLFRYTKPGGRVEDDDLYRTLTEDAEVKKLFNNRYHQENVQFCIIKGHAALDADHLEEAEKKYQDALRLSAMLGSSGESSANPIVAKILHSLGRLYWHMSDYPKARKFANRAMIINRRAFNGSPSHPFISYNLALIADIAYSEGNINEALDSYKKALSMLQETFGKRCHNVGVIMNLSGMAKCYIKLEKHWLASYYIKFAIELAKEQQGLSPSFLIKLQLTEAKIIGLTGKGGDPKEIKERFDRISTGDPMVQYKHASELLRQSQNQKSKEMEEAALDLYKQISKAGGNAPPPMMSIAFGKHREPYPAKAKAKCDFFKKASAEPNWDLKVTTDYEYAIMALLLAYQNVSEGPIKLDGYNLLLCSTTNAENIEVERLLDCTSTNTLLLIKQTTEKSKHDFFVYGYKNGNSQVQGIQLIEQDLDAFEKLSFDEGNKIKKVFISAGSPIYSILKTEDYRPATPFLKCENFLNVREWKVAVTSSMEYSLLLMPENAVLENLEKRRLYVKAEKDALKYKVITPSGELGEGEITTVELNHPINESFTLENLKALLPDILKITSKKGHTLSIEPGLERDSFYGVALINEARQELVFAFRGTEFHEIYRDINSRNGGDIGAGYQFYLDKAHEQVGSAISFVNTVKSQPKFTSYRTSYTGHSLGAILAEVIFCEWQMRFLNDQASNGDEVNNVDCSYAVTFESPGSADLINHMYKLVENEGLPLSIRSRVTSYQSLPNLVNTAKRHIGKQYFMPVIAMVNKVAPGYSLCHDDDPAVPEKHMEKHKLYVTFNPNGKSINYRVSEGDLVHEGNIACHDIDPAVPPLTTIDQLQPYLPKIVAIVLNESSFSYPVVGDLFKEAGEEGFLDYAQNFVENCKPKKVPVELAEANPLASAVHYIASSLPFSLLSWRSSKVRSLRDTADVASSALKWVVDDNFYSLFEPSHFQNLALKHSRVAMLFCFMLAKDDFSKFNGLPPSGGYGTIIKWPCGIRELSTFERIESRTEFSLERTDYNFADNAFDQFSLLHNAHFKTSPANLADLRSMRIYSEDSTYKYLKKIRKLMDDGTKAPWPKELEILSECQITYMQDSLLLYAPAYSAAENLLRYLTLPTIIKAVNEFSANPQQSSHNNRKRSRSDSALDNVEVSSPDNDSETPATKRPRFGQSSSGAEE